VRLIPHLTPPERERHAFAPDVNEGCFREVGPMSYTLWERGQDVFVRLVP